MSLSGRWGACVLLLGASVCDAAGLGGLTLRSSLGQPLDADIELVSLNPGEQVSATLASQADYRQAGAPFPAVLAGARFSVQTAPNGAPYLRVTTAQPVAVRTLELLIVMDTNASEARGQYSLRLAPAAQSRPQVLMPSIAFWTPKEAPAPATPARVVAAPAPAPAPKPEPQA